MDAVTVSKLIDGNLGQDLTGRDIQLVDTLWDNRDRIAVDPDGVEPPRVPDQPGGEHD